MLLGASSYYRLIQVTTDLTVLFKCFFNHFLIFLFSFLVYIYTSYSELPWIGCIPFPENNASCYWMAYTHYLHNSMNSFTYKQKFSQYPIIPKTPPETQTIFLTYNPFWNKHNIIFFIQTILLTFPPLEGTPKGQQWNQTTIINRKLLTCINGSKGYSRSFDNINLAVYLYSCFFPILIALVGNGGIWM